MDSVSAFQRFPIWKLYCVNLYYIDILNLGLMSDNNQSYRKYLLSLLSSSLYGYLYKPSKLVGLMKTDLTLF